MCQNADVMNKAKIIASLLKYFRNNKAFTKRDVLKFVAAQKETLPLTTINWQLHDLKKRGVIKSLGRGLYIMTDHAKSKIDFIPNFTHTHRKLFSKIKEHFPLATICLWPVRCLHEFMVHLPAVDWTIVEVERDVAKSVFSLLRQNRRDVYFNPDAKTMEQAVAYDRRSVIVKNLISESPLVRNEKIIFPCFEKILVDLFVDDVIYSPYQGGELRNIYRDVFEKHSINPLRLKRYARRRKVWPALQKFISQNV